MFLSSPDFKSGCFLPVSYTCDGEDISPTLLISGTPKEARSLVLIFDDPDAPGGDWVHWLLWNIDPKIKLIKKGKIPSGAREGLNDFGRNNYGGPCPPSGIHHYHLKIYALDIFLSLTGECDKAALMREMEGHILAKFDLLCLYGRGGKS